MKEIIDYLRDVWDIPLAQSIVLILATAITTHFFESRIQKREHKQKFDDVLGEKIATALNNVRNVALKTKTIEIYTENDNISTDNVNDINAFHNFVHYPEFMNDKESLLVFCSGISSLRSEYEQYLDLKSAAYLYGLEKYLMSLALFISKHDLGDCLPEVGCFVIVDVEKWERRFDVHLVKQINKPHYKLFSRHGKKWNIAKWYVRKSFLERSELNKVIQGTSKFPIEILLAAKERRRGHI